MVQVYDVDNEQFVMFFEAVDGADRHSIGLAVSQDGLTNWSVLSGQLPF